MEKKVFDGIKKLISDGRMVSDDDVEGKFIGGKIGNTLYDFSVTKHKTSDVVDYIEVYIRSGEYKYTYEVENKSEIHDLCDEFEKKKHNDCDSFEDIISNISTIV